MTKPKVLFIHQGGELYGSDRVFAQVVRYASDVVEPIVLLSSEGPLRFCLEPYCGEIYVREVGVLRRKHFTFMGSLRTFLQTVGAFFFVVYLAKVKAVAGIYTNTIGILASGVAAKFLRKPHVWHVHEIIVLPKFLSSFLSWYVPKFCSRLVCNSYATQRHLLRGRSKYQRKFRVIHNSVDYRRFEDARDRKGVRNSFQLKDEDVFVGVVGRVHYWKGQDDLLEAARLLKNEDEHVLFGIIGGVYDKQRDDWISKLMELAKRNRVEHRVFFRDFYEKVEDIYEALDIVVVPSKFPEPFGLVTVEAMAAGKPVIGTSHGGTVEIIQDGVTGFLVPPNNPNALAEKIRFLVHNPEVRMRMGKAGRERAKEKFSEEHFKRDIQGLLRETFI